MPPETKNSASIFSTTDLNRMKDNVVEVHKLPSHRERGEGATRVQENALLLCADNFIAIARF